MKINSRNCFVCGSENLIKSDIYFISCQGCGAEFTAALAGGDNYYEESYGAEGSGYGKDKWEFRKFFSDMRERSISGSLLDVGCGPGFLMVKAKENGFDSFGLDFNKFAVEKAVSMGLPNAKVGGVEEIEKIFPGQKFKVAVMFHVLEHLDEPAKILAEIRKNLQSDGFLAIAVPNSDRSNLRFNFRSKREGWDYPPHHVSRWKPGVFKKFLEGNEFSVLEVAEERVKTLHQIYKFIFGILHLWTSTGLMVVDETMGMDKRVPSSFNVKRALSQFKNVVLGILTLVFCVPVFVISKFVFLRGTNLYILAEVR